MPCEFLDSIIDLYLICNLTNTSKVMFKVMGNFKILIIKITSLTHQTKRFYNTSREKKLLEGRKREAYKLKNKRKINRTRVVISLELLSICEMPLFLNDNHLFIKCFHRKKEK